MTLSAPYNFVPVENRVVTAADLGLPREAPSQDDPATGGLCGELKIVLTAMSPFLVAGEQKEAGNKQFFETPDGRAIPGSTMRGMIRNVIEIASFARMWRVENRRFAMRDLTNGARLDYGDRMSVTHGNNTYKSLALGGWLTETSEGLFLEQVDYGRVEHKDLGDRFAQQAKKRGNSQKAEDKTAMALESIYCGPNPRFVWIEENAETHSHSNNKKLIYRKAYQSELNAAQDQDVDRAGGLKQLKAEIVFTGMPNASKHMAFAFPLPAGNDGIKVSDEVWRKFLDVHEKQEKPSPTWLDRRTKLRSGKRIPVFFLLKEGATALTAATLDQIGLSMMFKMASENKTHDMMPPCHVSGSEIDLPTRMFGRMSGRNDDAQGFRGRLSFGIMREVGRSVGSVA